MIGWLGIAWGAEGMWRPSALPEGPLAEVARRAAGAVVALDHCSGAFVSADGLVITNAHCVDRWLSEQSGDVDLLQTGFGATERSNELSAGPEAWIGLEVADEPVVGDPRRRAAQCERDRDPSCRLVEHLGIPRSVSQRVFHDVRLVYVPPLTVARFGGDADNFRWPRHDLDVAFVRVYEDGAPYRPGVWLRWSPAGPRDGDPVIVAHHPSETERNELAERLALLMEVLFPLALARQEATEAVLLRHVDAAPELRPQLLRIQNARGWVRGVLGATVGSSLLEAASAEGAALDLRAGGDPALASALITARGVVAEIRATLPGDHALEHLLDVTWLDAALTAVRWSEARAQRASDRPEGFGDADRDDLRADLESADAVVAYERELLASRLAQYQALPPEHRRAELDVWLAGAGGPAEASRTLFDKTALSDPDVRSRLVDGPLPRDPFIELATLLEHAGLAELRREDARRSDALGRVMPLVHRAVAELRGPMAIPDADGTLRLGVGQIAGYSPADGLVASSSTRLGGLAAKARRTGWSGPEWLLAAATRDEQVPVNFLSDLDTAAGSSGAPTLDRNGDLVGLVFDGTVESLLSDWRYEPGSTRTIHVDVRAVAWLLSQDPAGAHVRDELGLPRSVRGPR